MGNAAKKLKPATYDDIINLPDNVTGELINGSLYVSSRPSGKHSLATSGLGIKVGSAYQYGDGGPGGWWILDEPEIHFRLKSEVCVPDLAGWKKERMPSVPEDHIFTVIPDWVCEVISPSSLRIDRIIKQRIYASYGVPYYWLIDPQGKTLEVLKLKDGQWIVSQVFAENDDVCAEPFQEITFNLAAFWGEEPQPPGA